MQTVGRISFTTLVVLLIVLPLPPSTIVGVALASNKHTGKYMDQRTYRVVQKTMGHIFEGVRAFALSLAERRQVSAKIRIQQGTYRL